MTFSAQALTLSAVDRTNDRQPMTDSYTFAKRLGIEVLRL
jgi:hypothetical protein